MNLNPDEVERYGRHLAMKEFGLKEQELLKNAAVLVVGAGGLGSPILLYLTAAGVGTIGIIEDDTVDLSNLQRQILYTTDQIGESKIDSAKEHLLKINPHVTIVTYPHRLTSKNARAIIAQYDVVADGSDNFPTRYLVNDACLLEDKPNVYGSVLRFEGQVSVFNALHADGSRGPNYRHLYPVPPPPGLVPNCAEAGVLGVLPGIIGSMQASEVIKIITGLGEPLAGRLWIFDALSFESRMLQFGKNQEIQVTELIDYEIFCGLKHEDVQDIDPSAALVLSRKDNVQFIDVREQDEYQFDHIGAENIPLSILGDQLDKIDPKRPLVVHCQSGQRSLTAIQIIRKMYPEIAAINLTGGLVAWKKDLGNQKLTD